MKHSCLKSNLNKENYFVMLNLIERDSIETVKCGYSKKDKKSQDIDSGD